MLFGLLILVLLLAGLYYRRQQRRQWVAEERYDDSGAWLDKRSGERGTYGSLDAEREQARNQIAQKGRATELARLWRAYLFDQHPGFNQLTDAEIRRFTDFAREKTARLLADVTALPDGQWPDAEPPADDQPHLAALKKIALDFCYANYPKLLDLDLEHLRRLDQLAAAAAAALLNAIKPS
ncbi:MAG: hypothetical protein JNK89_06990 [Saprospiraceae bacterium]|nr:hypothetical protein [Saprospiraceae bacterium]